MNRLLLLPALAAAVLVVLFGGAAHGAKATFAGPNGRIAFIDYSSGDTGNVFTMDASGSNVRQVTSLTSDQGSAADPAWSPDGTKIVFTVFGQTGRLYLVNPDGSNMHLLFNEDPNYNDAAANFSPDGSRVIFRRCNFTKYEACAIYTVKINGNGLNAITKFKVNTTDDNFDVKPEYSPDGNTISFSSFNRGGVQNGIYLMGAHGNGIHLVTPTGLGAVNADWSPNGSKIVFWTHCCDPQEEAIATMNPDGTGITQLTHPGSDHDLNPSYSPHGDMIVFEHVSADFSTSTIETMSAAGGAATPIHVDATLIGGFSQPSWGPAGS